MPFNSIDFAVFFPIVFFIYWFCLNKNLKYQNIFIVIASFIFYGWWDWRFLFLILFSICTDYYIGLKLKTQENDRKRKSLLLFSIIINIGFLCFFKYYNFFIESFTEAFSFFGYNIKPHTLHIILPVGISFYTFQTLSYTIDVYKRKFEATKDFVAFAAFVSFFPLLVAGPIERAANFLPQFYKKRNFDYSKAIDGLRQVLWGLFKKIVIADNCAEYANLIFNNYTEYSGSALLLGALFFTFQIYGDFSGYSDIAIGISRLLGFNAMQNFAFPYFSRDIAEFWRRWHISLSSWFRDYVYIPLGGSKGNVGMKIRNTFILFLLSGFWHGANWTFIFWGFLNAVYFLPLLLTRRNRKNMEIVAYNSVLPSLKEFFQIVVTFTLTVFAWIFFRAENLFHAFSYISGIFSSSFFSFPELLWDKKVLSIFILLFFFIAVEWMGRRGKYALEKFGLTWKKPIRIVFYYLLLFVIFLFAGDSQEFIYFQF